VLRFLHISVSLSVWFNASVKTVVSTIFFKSGDIILAELIAVESVPFMAVKLDVSSEIFAVVLEVSAEDVVPPPNKVANTLDITYPTFPYFSHALSRDSWQSPKIKVHI
jgi:hypothetical protein